MTTVDIHRGTTPLGVLAFIIPAELTWFTYAYAAVGFGFGISYAVNLVRK